MSDYRGCLGRNTLRVIGEEQGSVVRWSSRGRRDQLRPRCRQALPLCPHLSGFCWSTRHALSFETTPVKLCTAGCCSVCGFAGAVGCCSPGESGKGWGCCCSDHEISVGPRISNGLGGFGICATCANMSGEIDIKPIVVNRKVARFIKTSPHAKRQSGDASSMPLLRH